MQITAHINAIKIPFVIPVAPGKNLDRFVYAYLIDGGSQLCLIDSGVAGAETLIAGELASLEKNIADISSMLLTHSHPDHIGGAQVIKQMCSCKVWAHPEARRWVEDVESQFKERPVPGFHTLVAGSVQIDRLIQDNEIIELGEMSLQVRHTPGHSRCSLSFFNPEEGVLFTGDAIPQGNDLPIYEDVAAAVQSIRRLQEIKGIKVLLASWRDPDTQADPYQIMDQGLRYFQRIHTALRELPGRKGITEPMELCRAMVEKLGLPEVAVNPLIAKSFVSHLPLMDQEEL